MHETHDYPPFLSGTIRIFSHFIPRDLDVDELRKRILVVGAAVMGIPALLFFSHQDVLINDTVGLIVDTAFALLLVLFLAVSRRIRNGDWIYRFLAVGLVVVLLYNFYAGPSGQSSILWMFLYPLMTFYIFGIFEGLVWYGIVLVFTSVTIFFPQLVGAYSYPAEMRSRFLVAYIIVSFFSLSFEFLRWHFYTQLKKATEKVRTLDGLVPICSVCKKIRDDKGYWNQVEEYLALHTDALLSHGICDECYSKEYPEEYAKRETRSMSRLSEHSATPSDNT